MATLLLSFKTKRNARVMLANSFRLHEIKQMLSQYGNDIVYDVEENKTAHIRLSETISEEKDNEISSLLANYFDRNYNKVDTYPDIAKEMEYINDKG